jgi:hypothetical protein
VRKTACLILALVLVAAAGLLLALGPTPASAGGCYSGASYSYGYSYYPSYSYSYPSYPAYYAAPSYSYYTPAKTYYPKYQVEEVVVPKAVKAYVSPDYFASVQDYYRDKVLLDAIAGKNTDTSKLKEELAELKAQIAKSQAQPPAQYANPWPGPAAYYPAPQAPYQQPPASAQTPYGPGYGQQPPQGGTPCDWRAQQAYQQGVQQGQQATRQAYPGPGAYQQPQTPTGPAQGPQQSPPQVPAQPGPQEVPQPRQQAPQPREQVPAQPREQQEPPPAPSSRESPAPEGEVRSRASQGDVPDGLASVVKDNCLRCHGPTKDDDGNGFDLRDLEAVPLENRLEAYAQVASGDMPNKAEPLVRAKVVLFKKWCQAARKQKVLKVASR